VVIEIPRRETDHEIGIVCKRDRSLGTCLRRDIFRGALKVTSHGTDDQNGMGLEWDMLSASVTFVDESISVYYFVLIYPYLG